MENQDLDHDEHLDIYGDGLTSADAKVPRWLKWSYILLPIWGVIIFILYWNGSHGFLDRGSWKELQEAANTTFPFINHNTG